jgi:hypothetical protein
VAHDDATGVARQALRGFRGNANAVFEDRLAGVIGIREQRGIDMDDHLVALARGAGVDAVVQCRLSQQGEGVTSSALISSAPISGARRPRTVTVPSSS